MPALQTCDQAARGLAYNTLGETETLENGAVVSMTIRWVWDTTSVWPNCDGPLQDGSGQAGKWAVQAVNNGTAPAYCHTVRRDGTPMTWTLNPGQTANVTAAQAANNGYTKVSDFANLTLTTTP